MTAAEKRKGVAQDKKQNPGCRGCAKPGPDSHLYPRPGKGPQTDEQVGETGSHLHFEKITQAAEYRADWRGASESRMKKKKSNLIHRIPVTGPQETGIAGLQMHLGRTRGARPGGRAAGEPTPASSGCGSAGSPGCKSTSQAPSSPTMEFTDGLFRHLLATGQVPSLLILDFQLSLYLSLWVKTCKTRHQNPDQGPFQVVLKTSAALLDFGLEQMLGMAEGKQRRSNLPVNFFSHI